MKPSSKYGVNVPLPKGFSKLVRSERAKQALGQVEYARTLGISQAALAKIESGARKHVSIGLWEKLSNIGATKSVGPERIKEIRAELKRSKRYGAGLIIVSAATIEELLESLP